MKVVDALLKGRTARTPDTVRVAAALRADAAAGLAALVRALESPAFRETPHDARFAALEALRVDWRAALEPSLASLRNQPIPLLPDELATLHRAGRALRALRDAYLSVHDALADPRPDAPPAPRALLALARALDAQSRLLVAACRLRVALPREDWDAVCRLAYPLWVASAFDETYPDPSSSARAETPRAAFVLPLLLRLLEPLGLSAAQLDAAAVLARRAARGAGVRIEVDGLPHVCAEGPALMLSASHAVRLETRETLEQLGRIRERLAQGASPASLGLRTSLTAATLDALLVALATVWGPYHVPTPLTRPPAPAGLMHVGLPRRARAAEGRAAEPLAPPDAPPASGASPYVYGRAFAVAAPAARGLPEPSPAEIEEAREAAVRATMEAIAAPVEWRGQDARRAVFARAEAEPRLRLGQLVAVLPMRTSGRPGARPGSRTAGALMPLRVGRVVTLAQTGVADGREPFAHDIGVAWWPGAAVPVRVRFDGSSAFEDAWWTPAATAEAPASLLVRRDRFEAPCHVLVRESARDVELRVRRLLEQGPDFDRLEVGPIG